ncbi:MAG TPA: hypothetical protein VD790_02945 [Thermoleophilaceae bacterium]|nr:hypothetical protein [Thermoleophilaceae bacterium]
MRFRIASLLASLLFAAPAAAQTPAPTPRAECGPGSRPAPGMQGRVTADAPADGYTCNTELVGHEGSTGGFKVERFTDRAGRTCVYYDTTLLFPTQAIEQLQDEATGVAVTDITDPAKPVRVGTLVTPAMETPHESLALNEKRGLLVAVMGNPLSYPGFIDVYDVNADCRNPRLLASTPVGLLGHESGFAPDGMTYYATSLFSNTVTAVDLTDPRLPTPITVAQYPSHGMGVSADGSRAYFAAREVGLIIADLSAVQARAPSPQIPEISRLDWPTRTVPQNNLPVTFDGEPHLVEVDEFSAAEDGSYDPRAPGPRVGAARIIDISDETAPKVISDIRLEVHQPENREEIYADPGAGSNLQGYAAHYCGVPQVDDPPIVACTMIVSGLRVFDIRDPHNPREVAYFVAPPGAFAFGEGRFNNTLAKPAFDIERKTIWYSDGNSGLYGVRLTNGTWPDAGALPERCAPKRRFRIVLAKRFRSARVKVNGRRVKVKRRGGRLRARVKLNRRGVAKVRIAGKTHSGKRVVRLRRYELCP